MVSFFGSSLLHFATTIRYYPTLLNLLLKMMANKKNITTAARQRVI